MTKEKKKNFESEYNAINTKLNSLQKTKINKIYESINIVSENSDSISSPSFDSYNGTSMTTMESGGEVFVSIDVFKQILEKLEAVTEEIRVCIYGNCNSV